MSSFLTGAPDNVWMNKGFLRPGLWRAKVLNNVDTQGRGRIQIRSYHLHPEPLPPSGALESVNMGGGRPDEALGEVGEVVNRASQQGIPDNLCPWAEPAFPFGGNTASDAGFFMLPEIGSTVWVAFEMGFVGRPVWLGSWLGSGEVPTEAAGVPQFVRIIKTPMGHILMFSDDDTNPFIQIYSKTGHQLLLDEQPGNQAVTLQSAHGHSIKIDENLTSIKAELFGAPNTKMELLPTSAALSIGTNSIVVTPSGITITINGYTISLNSAGDTVITANGIMTINANGVIILGTGAVKGVALDSLLTVLNTFIGIFNAHTHEYSPGGGLPIPTAGPVAPGVTGTPGVDTSVTVLARV